MSATLDLLIARLRGDSQLQAMTSGDIYHDLVPQGTTGIYIVVRLQHAGDLYELGGVRALTDSTYLVVAVEAGTSAAGVEAAANRIDAVLTNSTLTMSGHRSMTVHREEVQEFVEPQGDLRWQHRGGLYRVMVQPA